MIAAINIDSNTVEARYIALLGLLKLGRMYRVAVMFRNMSYNLNLSLLALTITRNLTVCWCMCASAVGRGKVLLCRSEVGTT